MDWGLRLRALTVKPGLAASALRAIQPQPGAISPASRALELALDWTRDLAPTAATRSLMLSLEWGQQPTIAAAHRCLFGLGLQEIPSSGLAPLLMSVVAALSWLEQWVNWLSFQALTVQTVKRATMVMVCHSLTVLAPQGRPWLSSRMILVLM